MRLYPKLSGVRLAALAAAAVLVVAVAGRAQQPVPPEGKAVTLSAGASVQDVTSAIERHRANLGAGAEGRAARPADAPWFGFRFTNPTAAAVERLLVVRRPMLAGAGWSAGVAPALPRGPAVEWLAAGAPETLSPFPGAGGAGVFAFGIPAGGEARLAVPGAEGPVLAGVLTREAYAGSAGLRFVILGLGFGLLGALAALSVARWLGAGDRAAAASAAVGLAGIWVLATQFGHHVPLTGAGGSLDAGMKAAGQFLLAGALLVSMAMQAALPERLLRGSKAGALGCGLLAVLALPVGLVHGAAGPVLLAAALTALAAALADARAHPGGWSVRLPDLVSLALLALVLLAAAGLASGDASLAADRWSVLLFGGLIVALAVFGGSGLVLHHGVAVPLLADFRPPERTADPSPAALGPEPAASDLTPHEVAADSGPPDAVDGREALIRDLRSALARAELAVAYQPIIALSDGSVAGFEALARWERAGHGPVPPDVFVPLAEKMDVIGALDALVLDEAVRRLGEWQREVPGGETPPRLNVNVSARRLADPDLVRQVRRLLEREHIAPGTLTLELTEHEASADPQAALNALLELRELGVGLALDDFGAGAASLARLRDMPFDMLKIDRAFVAGLKDPRGRQIVQATITLAHDLDMGVTAEGAAEAADLECLRAMGCDFVQGPFCGPPLRAAAAEAVLRRDRSARAPERPFSTGSA